MARGANLKGRWGNGQPYDSVRRTGFVENTITNPKAEAALPEKAARLMWVSDPWYVISGPGTGPTSGMKMRSAAGGSTGGDEPESRPHNTAPKTKIPTLPPFK